MVNCGCRAELYLFSQAPSGRSRPRAWTPRGPGDGVRIGGSHSMSTGPALQSEDGDLKVNNGDLALASALAPQAMLWTWSADTLDGLQVHGLEVHGLGSAYFVCWLFQAWARCARHAEALRGLVLSE